MSEFGCEHIAEPGCSSINACNFIDSLGRGYLHVNSCVP